MEVFKNHFCKKSLMGLLCFLFIFAFFDPLGAGADFDFYAMDLIGRESYRRISMDFRDANLKSILKIFSEQSGLNFIASQAVQDRTMTLYLDNVPLQEALKKIMSANNLTYELDPGSNIFVVKELGRPDIETITKVFYLKYTRLQASKLQKAIDSVQASCASALGGESGSGGGGGSSGGGSAGGAAGVAATSGIEQSVTAVLTKNGKVVTDMRTNSLVVTDIPSQFDVIEKVIVLLDTPTPQVMIEVEMLDVSKQVIDEMGVDTTAEIMKLTGSSGTVKFPEFLAKGADPGSSLFSYGLLDASVFTATLELLSTDTTTKFLARPRILTLSNESAEIMISTNEAIGQNTVTTSAEGSATQTVEAERYMTGVSLRVTPQVDVHSGTVTMFVQPTVAEAKTGATFANTTYKDPEIRSSSSTLMVKSGQTIVVGGLIRDKNEKTVKKVPFFGDIPLLGALFRHRDETKEERELLVFITPHIVDYQEAVNLAKGEAVFSRMPAHREQSATVARKEEIDNMLERWEN